MSFPLGYAAYTQAFGTAPAGVSFPVYLPFAPGPTTIQGPYGVYTPGQVAIVLNVGAYVLIGYTSSQTGLSANWVQVANSSGAILAIAGTSPVAVSTVAGTATVSIVSSPSFGGTTTSATGFTATSGNFTATTGNLVLNGAGSKVLVSAATPASASIGTSVAMIGGTTTVASTAVTAASKIFLTSNTPGGTAGTLSAPTASIVPGVSFVINSSNAADTASVNYWIIN